MARKSTFEFKHNTLTATVRRSVGRTWYIILTEEKTNSAWTSGVYGKMEAINDAVKFITGILPLPSPLHNKVTISKEYHTGTIEQRKRTCSHCMDIYPTMELFGQHWKVCPARHLGDEFEPNKEKARR